MVAQHRPHVVFVCTGNIFRSLSAEFGMRAADTSGDYSFASAGTDTHLRRRLRSDVLDANTAHGINAAIHESRPLTQEIVDGADLLVAMDETHQKHIRDTFNRHAPLFLEISRGTPAGIPDLPDIIPDYKDRPAESRAYVKQAVDGIMGERAGFMANLPKFITAGRKPA